jgi:DNA-directed RNA polymerase beta' subunit
LGEHTEELLRQAGLSDEDIAVLTQSGAALTAEQAAKSVGTGGD